MSYRILFVDDDPQLLSSLRNALRRDRQRWDMVFVNGGVAALAELCAITFDVMVCDLRMPGIDGARLLEVVRDESPRTRRLILSGTADMDALESARSIAHELLCKPCTSAELRAAITRQLEDASTSLSS